jgi:hypothetical protein
VLVLDAKADNALLLELLGADGPQVGLSKKAKSPDSVVISVSSPERRTSVRITQLDALPAVCRTCCRPPDGDV